MIRREVSLRTRGDPHERFERSADGLAIEHEVVALVRRGGDVVHVRPVNPRERAEAMPAHGPARRLEVCDGRGGDEHLEPAVVACREGRGEVSPVERRLRSAVKAVVCVRGGRVRMRTRDRERGREGGGTYEVAAQEDEDVRAGEDGQEVVVYGRVCYCLMLKSVCALGALSSDGRVVDDDGGS